MARRDEQCGREEGMWREREGPPLHVLFFSCSKVSIYSQTPRTSTHLCHAGTYSSDTRVRRHTNQISGKTRLSRGRLRHPAVLAVCMYGHVQGDPQTARSSLSPRGSSLHAKLCRRPPLSPSSLARSRQEKEEENVLRLERQKRKKA